MPLISIIYLFKYFFQNFIFLCKESINDIINIDEVDTNINKDNINLPKKDSDERFYE